MKQVILGAGGTIAKDLAKELSTYTSDIRLVSRNPKKVNDSDELYPADLSIPENIEKSIAGASVVYLMVGFAYDIKVWQKEWIPLVTGVVDACAKIGARLVFFDNVYMYDRDFLGNMDENTPIRPTSKKGEIRRQVADIITHAYTMGKIQALIARSADFYGPANDKSVLVETVVKNFQKKKPAQWFCRLDKVHTFTYTPDAAKATAILGNTPDAYNQLWHLPTSSEKWTGKDWIKAFADEMKVANKSQVAPQWLLNIIGLFVPIMKELAEMAYQYDRDYVFNSSKFEQRFQIKPTPVSEGIKATAAFYSERF